MLSSTIELYKNAYTGLSRKTWYLSVVMLINRSGTMVVPFLTIYATQELRLTIIQAGFVMGLFGIGAVAGAFIGGRITDWFGFYPMQILSLFFGGIMFIVTGYMHTYESLCISTFILSICNESFRPANATAIAFYSKEENRTRSYSLNRLAVNLGWAVGGALGGFLASVSFELLFWVDGCTNICAALLLLKLLPYVKSGNRHASAKETTVTKAAWKDAVYVLFLLLTVLFATCFFHLFTILPVFYKESWQLTEQFIGILMAINGIIIVFIEMALIYKLEGTRSNTSFIQRGVFMVGVGYALINILPDAAWSSVLSMVIITLGEIFSMPFMNSFWISRTSATNRGQYAAMYTIAWSIAQITAPTLGSQVAANINYTTLWWLIAALCLLVSIGFMLLGKKISRQSAVLSQ
ncbi:MFS transporter [Panacibacter sp. DH6]|uniref:MFS transporter n=1 Tax=Panacibacter microcysteis TaxID=2793269 RepID=A0A931GYU7_9BACT|nr:MFS transporter [Panacibacter microcysteis]MBG9377862.1 MFS transporter [Panacibacter microcysteis]